MQVSFSALDSKSGEVVVDNHYPIMATSIEACEANFKMFTGTFEGCDCTMVIKAPNLVQPLVFKTTTEEIVEQDRPLTKSWDIQ